MKQVYGNNNLVTGAHTAGVVRIQVIPREWITQDPVIDYMTGKVIVPIQFATGKAFFDLSFIPESYTFSELPKSNKSGTYYEISAGGTSNDLSPDSQQQWQTIRYHECICLVMDMQKRLKLVGNREHGATIQQGHETNNKTGGTQSVPVTIYFESEDPAPFYET